MNRKQQAKYGELVTWTTPIHRGITCRFCGWHVTVARRGPGANALAAAAKLKGMLMQHLAAVHQDKLEGGGK